MKYVKAYEIFESQVNAVRLEIPYVSFAKKNDKGEFDPTKKISGKSKIIDYASRKIVVFDVNGVNVPFYLSSGTGGKKDVEAGKWYPFFGIAKDGWLNKSTGVEINNYYGVDLFKQISQMLNSKIGDIRGDDTIPKVLTKGLHIDFINRDLSPTENEMPYTKERFYQNLNEFKKKLKV
jgi:hypothetical protein